MSQESFCVYSTDATWATWFSLSADVWFGSSAIFQLHILHRPLCPCLFHYSNHILITFPLSQMANNSIKPQFSLYVWFPPWMDWLPSSRVGLMQIILQQICSGTVRQLAEMRVMQWCSFEVMPHNERWILVPDDILALKLVCSGRFFFCFFLPIKEKQVGVCHL